MKHGGFFGVKLRVPFWTAMQEKKERIERENQAKRIEAIYAQALAEDRYWQAIKRRIEQDQAKLATPRKFPTIKFPGDES